MRPHPALARSDHRPWPLPSRTWSWRQSWHDLLFAHWRVPLANLRPLIPSALRIDEFDGSPWIGLVPFRMTGVTRWPVPPLPLISGFPELNVRTYVRHGDKPGVWFFSLDAANLVAVWAGRRFFHLPYHRADMVSHRTGDAIRYRSRRRRNGPAFQANYGPTGPTAASESGTLEHWLTERYCLYAVNRVGTLSRTDIHHTPWPLQQAEAEITTNTMLNAIGIPQPDGRPLLHFARRLDVVIWSPTSARGTAATGIGGT